MQNFEVSDLELGKKMVQIVLWVNKLFAVIHIDYFHLPNYFLAEPGMKKKSHIHTMFYATNLKLLYKLGLGEIKGTEFIKILRWSLSLKYVLSCSTSYSFIVLQS